MAYITQTDLENFEKKHPKSGDTQPENYCNSAMEMIRNFLGYDPESQSYTTTVKGDGGQLATLKAPIISISAFSVDGVNHNVNEIEHEEQSNYVSFLNEMPFEKGHRYTFSYTGGFATVPSLIKTTALQIAALFWESDGGNIAVSSTSFADSGSRVFNNFKADRFLEQLTPYKRVIV